MQVGDIESPLGHHQILGDTTAVMVEGGELGREIDPEDGLLIRRRPRVVDQGLGDRVARQRAEGWKADEQEALAVLSDGRIDVSDLLVSAQPAPTANSLGGVGSECGRKCSRVLAEFEQPEEPAPGQSNHLGDKVLLLRRAVDVSENDLAVFLDPGQDLEKPDLGGVDGGDVGLDCWHRNDLLDRKRAVPLVRPGQPEQGKGLAVKSGMRARKKARERD